MLRRAPKKFSSETSEDMEDHHRQKMLSAAFHDVETINPFFPRLRSGHRLFQGPPAESKVLAANPFFPRLRSGHRLFQGPPAESKVLAASKVLGTPLTKERKEHKDEGLEKTPPGG